MVAGGLMDNQAASISRDSPSHACASQQQQCPGVNLCTLLGGWADMSYLRNQPYDERDLPAFAAIREQLGFLPNFFVEENASPYMVATEIAMTGNLILKEGALPRRQKEYIFLVCSAANLSTYCVTAHCEMVRMLKLEGPEPEQIAVEHIHDQILLAEKSL